MPAPLANDDYRVFIRFAATFEASLALVAMLLGWIVGVRPDLSAPSLLAVTIGVAATLPMIGFYAIISGIPWKSLSRIQDLLLTTLGRPLSQCRWHELLLLSVTAGLCEELLFRGVLQPWLSSWGTGFGWIGTNLLFGAAHAVTPMYFVLAALIGGYLSGTAALAGSLYAPIIAHTLYDWFAFTQLAKAYRASQDEMEHTDNEGDDENQSDTKSKAHQEDVTVGAEE